MSKQTWKANHLNGNGHSSINDINDISFILQSTEITTNKQQKLHKNQLKIKIDDLKTFQPLTENQSKFFSLYNEDNSFIMLHGVAGTGKTFCALYKSIEEILMKGKYNKLLVVRSAVQGREIGHLPGSVDEKLDIYQLPYKQICETLFDRKDAWDRLEEQKHVEFVSTSFIRGMTFDNCIIIVDECQNLTWEELDSIMTRVGYNSKILFCGDYRQTDLNKKKNDMSGLLRFKNVTKKMRSLAHIEFGIEDIIRSNIVKEYIIAKMNYDDNEEDYQ